MRSCQLVSLLDQGLSSLRCFKARSGSLRSPSVSLLSGWIRFPSKGTRRRKSGFRRPGLVRDRSLRLLADFLQGRARFLPSGLLLLSLLLDPWLIQVR